MGNTIYGFAVGIVLCAVGSGLNVRAASDTADTKSIIESFSDLQMAIKARDLNRIVPQFSTGTMAFFRDCRKLALHPDWVDLETKSQVAVLIAFQARWLIDVKTLTSMSARDLLEWGIQNGTVPLEALAHVELMDIRITTNRATAYIRSGGSVVPNTVLTFEQRDGMWKLDLKAMLHGMEPNMQEMRAERGLTKAEVAVMLLEANYQQRIPSLRELLLPRRVRQEIARLQHADPSIKYDAIISELSAGRQKDAEGMLDVFVSLHTNDQQLAFAQAVCSRSRWNKRDAAMGFSQVLRLNPATLEGSCAKSVLDLAQRRRVPENMKTLRFLADQNPDYPLILWIMAVESRDHFRLTGETTYSKDAEACYRRMLEIFEIGPVLLHQTFANVLAEELHNREEGLKHRRIAVKMEPAGWTYQGLGNTLSEMGRYDEANQAFTKMIEYAPRDARFYASWALSLFKQQNYEECISKCEKVIEFDPSDFETYYRWGHCLLELKQESEVLEKFLACLNIKPDYAPALNQIGIMYELGTGVTRDYTEAAAWFRKAADQGLAIAQSNLAMLHIKSLAMYEDGSGVTNDPAAVAAWHRNAAELGVPAAQYHLGLMYEDGREVAKDDKEALKWYRRASIQGYWQAGDRLRKLMASSGMNITASGGTQVVAGVRTPLHNAAYEGNIAEVKRFLADGADVNAGDDQGVSPLMFAASNGRTEMIRVLLAEGAAVNAKDILGNTALSLAVSTGTETVKLLVDAGADVNSRDIGDLTPLSSAIRMGRKEVADILRKHGAKD